MKNVTNSLLIEKNECFGVIYREGGKVCKGCKAKAECAHLTLVNAQRRVEEKKKLLGG